MILACADGRLRVFDVGSGRLLRDVEFPDALTATPCLLDGTLYVGTYGGALWALAGLGMSSARARERRTV